MADLRSLEVAVRQMVKAGRGLVQVQKDLAALREKLTPEQQHELDAIIGRLTENVREVATSATSTSTSVEQLVRSVR